MERFRCEVVGAAMRRPRWAWRQTQRQLYQNQFGCNSALTTARAAGSAARPAAGARDLLALEQRVQAARLVERIRVVEAADVGLAHVTLRHRAAAGLLHHDLALFRVEV